MASELNFCFPLGQISLSSLKKWPKEGVAQADSALALELIARLQQSHFFL